MRELSPTESLQVFAGMVTCTVGTGASAEPCSSPGWRSVLDQLAGLVSTALEKLADWLGG